jgi:HEPN domain-containing protein
MGKEKKASKRSLIRRAVRDFELARRYGEAREYMTESVLYQKAAEKILRALSMKRAKRLPKNASIVYLAKKAEIPESIYGDLMEMPDERSEIMEEEDRLSFMDMEKEDDQNKVLENAERSNAMTKRGVVKRLMDYAMASANL